MSAIDHRIHLHHMIVSRVKFEAPRGDSRGRGMRGGGGFGKWEWFFGGRPGRFGISEYMVL